MNIVMLYNDVIPLNHIPNVDGHFLLVVVLVYSRYICSVLCAYNVHVCI